MPGLALADAPDTLIEKEEYQRTLWNLFFLDRDQSWASSWPHVLDDRYFMVNIPCAEKEFQENFASTPDLDQSVPFNLNLSKLISKNISATQYPNILQYLIKAYVILGRVSEHIHALHDSDDREYYDRECDNLDSHLVRFRLILPRSATSIFAAPTNDRIHAVRLTKILNTITILLSSSRSCGTPTFGKQSKARNQ
ncbi:hypothetical protein K432DRAFT_410781 [Lepidopterella palustris CBS 459.81]|uniref:Transcription factor domain-containing protein n=1 Tax=Lepidopterella palustris CBS 459.81 TaxID=1314670 RepID=A0A8E2DXA4_9PEZI|nr:hypothetical protein K432DRAFT_410781 [Lepidopterella palustris CBS 459.81]